MVKGRVTTKTNKRSWNNAKGSGTLFAFDIKDTSGDIRMTAFKSDCDRLFDLIKVGEIYLVSRGTVKPANKQYTHTTSDYEVTLNSDSIVELCTDETNCPEITYDFKMINQLESHYGGFVDIIGIIKSIHEVETIKTKTNRETAKRNIIIVDQTKSEVVLAVWGDIATDFPGELEDVIVVRGVKVSEYSGVSLSTASTSTVEINPRLEKVHEMKGWYSRVKDNLETNSLTKPMHDFHAEWNNLVEITPENVQKENSLTLRTKAVVYQMGKPNMYKACDCKKKLVDLNNGFFRCEKCRKETDHFEWKIILSFGIADHTKNVWVS